MFIAGNYCPKCSKQAYVFLIWSIFAICHVRTTFGRQTFTCFFFCTVATTASCVQNLRMSLLCVQYLPFVI